MMNFDEFVQKYKPITNRFTTDGPYNNMLFDTHNLEEIDFVHKSKDRTVWTLVEGEMETSWILAGYNLVNRMGFFITEIPWDEGHLVINDNEVVDRTEAAAQAFKFLEKNGIMVSGNKLSDYFVANAEIIVDKSIASITAKYLLIDYYEDNYGEITEELRDLIDNYYSETM